MRARILGLCLAVPLLIDGCESTTAIEVPLTVSGTIVNRSGGPIPENTVVYVMWGVSSGSPDYNYIFGQGTINPNDGTFSVTFYGEPPAEALNDGQLGVGLVIATTDQLLTTGKISPTYDFASTFVGASEDHVVIFRKSSPQGFPNDWPSRFPIGFSVGEVERSQTTRDSFKKVANDALRLVIDALQNINPPNWT